MPERSTGRRRRAPSRSASWCCPACGRTPGSRPPPCWYSQDMGWGRESAWAGAAAALPRPAPAPGVRACGCRLQRGHGAQVRAGVRGPLCTPRPSGCESQGRVEPQSRRPPSQSTAGCSCLCPRCLPSGHSELSRRSTASAETDRATEGAVGAKGQTVSGDGPAAARRKQGQDSLPVSPGYTPTEWTTWKEWTNS